MASAQSGSAALSTRPGVAPRTLSHACSGGYGGQMNSTTEQVTATLFRAHHDGVGIVVPFDNALINGVSAGEAYSNADLLVDAFLEYVGADGTHPTAAKQNDLYAAALAAGWLNDLVL